MCKRIVLIWVCLVQTAFIFGQIPIATKDGFHLIDEYDGELLTLLPYDLIHQEESHVFLAVSNGSFKYLDSNGELLISKEFQLAYPFKNEFALIGHNGQYHYINKTGQQFDTLSWPKMPTVYKDLLLYGHSPMRIVNAYGEELLASSHQLIVASQNGIYEWDKSQRTVHHYFYNNRSLRLVNSYEGVDTVALTWQGYACIEFDSTFSIYSDRGEVLFDSLPPQQYYRSTKIIWNTYLCLGDEMQTSGNYEDELGIEPLYDAVSMITQNGRNKYGPTVLLYEAKRNESVARLKGTRKWVLFNNHQIDGRYLFDQVLPSNHDRYLLVQINGDWFQYDVRKDSITVLPYRFIHPQGLQNHVFFGSNDPASLEHKKWSYHHLKAGIKTDEVYTFLPKPTRGQLLTYQSLYASPDYTYYILKKDSQLVVFNRKGEAIYHSPYYTPPLRIWNDYFQPEFYLKAQSVGAIENKNGLAKNKLQLRLTQMGDSTSIELINTTKAEQNIELYNGYVAIDLEFKTGDNQWKTFTRFPSRYHTDYSNFKPLLPEQVWKDKVYLPAGNSSVWVRAKFSNSFAIPIYSEPIQMNLYAAMLFGNQYFSKYGAFYQYQTSEHF